MCVCVRVCVSRLFCLARDSISRAFSSLRSLPRSHGEGDEGHEEEVEEGVDERGGPGVVSPGIRLPAEQLLPEARPAEGHEVS